MTTAAGVFTVRSFYRFVITAGLCGLIASACSGPSSVSSIGAVPQAVQRSRPLAGATPIPFSFQTVDDPSSTVNRVNAITKLGEIVGNVGSGTPSSPLGSYTAVPPYNDFVPLQIAGVGVGATSISGSGSTLTIAGYIITPPQLRGTWALALFSGIPYIFKDRKEGKNSDAVTEILGINGTDFGVGYYLNVTGASVPVVVNLIAEKFTALKPPGYKSAQATGINDTNHITGWDTTSAGTAGFYLKAGTYYSFTYPGSAATEATGINNQDQVVGYYQDSAGLTHGFVLNSPMGGSQQTWQSLDDPNAVHGTWVTGINDNDEICGYYIDGSGVQHGFVATP
jgi:hypothetical protein